MANVMRIARRTVEWRSFRRESATPDATDVLTDVPATWLDRNVGLGACCLGAWCVVDDRWLRRGSRPRTHFWRRVANDGVMDSVQVDIPVEIV